MWRALAISLALHALALWPQLPPRLAERAGSVLHATLRPPAAGPAAQAEAPSPPPPPAPSPRRAAAVPSPLAVPPAPTFPSAPPAAAGAGATADSTAAAPERSAAVAPTAAMAGTGEATAGAAAGPASIGPEPEAQRQYRMALAREARRFKRYPERARLDGVGGTVEVRVEHESGRAPVARLARSSGNAALDAAALDMMRLAAPRARVPESLRGRSFAVNLPVVFDISEEE